MTRGTKFAWFSFIIVAYSAWVAAYHLNAAAAEPAPVEVLSPGWHKGPVPKNTWSYGGVVRKGDSPHAGFRFASFMGDKVMLFDNSLTDRDPANTIVPNDQIGYWNNSLTTPIVRPKGRVREEDMLAGPQPRYFPAKLKIFKFDGDDDNWARRYDLLKLPQ